MRRLNLGRKKALLLAIPAVVTLHLLVLPLVSGRPPAPRVLPKTAAGGFFSPASFHTLVVPLGVYTARLDYPENCPCLAGCPPTFSLWRGGTKLAEEGFARALDPHTGHDVNGDGHPDAIVHLHSRGAHCCYATILYSLGEVPMRYVVESGSHCPGEFRDLNGDGVYEFLTCDDSFAYKFCSFAQSPLVRVVLKFMPGQGYVPASPEFPEIYAEEIAQHRAQAEETLNQGPSPDRDGTPKCVVLALVLDYLYSGHPEKAWEALYHYYRYPDVEGFRRAIEDTVRRSRYSPGCLEGLEG
ncbi:MAG: hypothetical protein QXP01_00150 [Candidatus Hadarchaeum sp.]